MEFEINGKKHILRGGSSEVELKIVSIEQLDKILPYSAECSLIQLCNSQPDDAHCFSNAVTLVNEDKVPAVIEQLLHKYASIFKEPTQLPPHRRHDHRIPLKE